MDLSERDDLIEVLFHLQLNQTDILSCLVRFGYILSARHLRRILAAKHLRKRKYSDIASIALFINNELTGSGKLHGYRWMWHKLLENGLRARKEDVRLILSCLDPQGVTFRKARRLRRRCYHASGPNFIWHIDGYDKIKRFGLAIHGCIDGFSRNIMWLNVYTTNNDPKIVGGYFFNAISEYSGCPRIVRADAGTENVNIRRIQEELMGNGRNGNATSYIKSKSTSNQRIEAFWGHLRKQCMDHWIAMLCNLEDTGDFLGDFVDKNIAQFSFMGVVQNELDSVARVWNKHTIRQSRRGLPSGRPIVMFEIPSLYDTRSYMTTISHGELHQFSDLCAFRTSVPCDQDMYVLSCQVLSQLQLKIPSTIDEALQVYLQLRQNIRTSLNI